jgi:glucokinase
MYLGIEIGGTKLQLGVGAGDGHLAGLWRGPVDVSAGPDGIRRQIIQAVPELLNQSGIDRARIKGIGIGFGGPVDDHTHTIIKSHQIEGWDNFPLEKWLSDLLGMPAVLGNDADVAGLAEALFGAGKSLSPILYITIGSGIGGGLIINGEIYRGCGRGAAEIGHLKVREWGQVFNLSGPSAASGKLAATDLVYFPLEEHASGWAISRKAREALSRGVPSSLQNVRLNPDESLTAEQIAQAASQHDALARTVLREAQSHLADAICHVIALLCPRRIVIGGGVSLMGEKLLFEPLREMVAERVFKPFADCYEIVPAALSEEVVVHGALALAKRKLGP